MRKIVLTYGLITGAIFAACIVLGFVILENSGGMWVGYTIMVLAFLLIYFGIRRYRDTVAGGTIGFGRAFGVGSLIMVIGIACYVATWEVVFFNFQPDYLQRYNAKMLAEAEAKGATPAELEAQRAEAAIWEERYQNPLINSAITFTEPLLPGLLVTLVSAGLLSRKRRDAGA